VFKISVTLVVTSNWYYFLIFLIEEILCYQALWHWDKSWDEVNNLFTEVSCIEPSIAVLELQNDTI
jgi:hypothetical protein